MQVSAKVPHSFYRFLQNRSFDLFRLFEISPVEMELIKNPSGWLEARRVEQLLARLFQEYSPHFVEEDFIVCVGHSCFELKAWGELDSVLKMRGNQSVFSNLPVFLSYFLTGGFSIRELQEESGLLSFKSNLSSENHPFITEYLRAVMESLPLYTGRHKARAKWIRNYVQIQWSEGNPQGLLFKAPSSFNFKPELIRDFRLFLEKVEKELYQNQNRIKEKDRQIKKLKDQFLLQGMPPPGESLSCLKEIQEAVDQIQNQLHHFKKTNSLSEEALSSLYEHTTQARGRVQDLKKLLE